MAPAQLRITCLTTMHWYLTTRSQSRHPAARRHSLSGAALCGFPNFRIWSYLLPRMPHFVCWSHGWDACNDCGFTGDLSEKPFINHLKMDEMFETRHILLRYSKTCLKGFLQDVHLFQRMIFKSEAYRLNDFQTQKNISTLPLFRSVPIFSLTQFQAQNPQFFPDRV